MKAPTLADLRRADLPPTLPFLVGARALGFGRSGAYSAKRAGRFPVPVIELGPAKWVVPTAAVLAALNLNGERVIEEMSQ